MSQLLTPTAKKVMEELHLKNVHTVPAITKVVVNVGVGKKRDNAAFLRAVEQDLSRITGQKPQQRMARKAVAGFSVRQNDLVGYRVTLRGKRMHDFVQRFVHVTLPRVRDFRGIAATALDGHGNLNVGLIEHMPFPEIRAEKTDVTFGVQVTFVTSTQDQEQGRTLFRVLGFPLKV